MKFETYQGKSIQPLAEKYSCDFSAVEALFEHDPWEETAWDERLAWLEKRESFCADRESLVHALRQFNLTVGNSPEALKAIEDLRDARTAVVMGGQQAGLFTGPLLVIYKAITIIRKAKEASEKLGIRVVPVFWIAGEDHDFDEVNHIFYLSNELKVEKMKLPHPTGMRTSVNHVPIDRNLWAEMLGQLSQSLPDSEFKPGLVEKIRQINERSATLVDSFAQLLAWLFGSHGLVLANSDDAELRRVETKMFRRLIAENERLNEVLLDGRRSVEKLGFVPQTEVNEEQANLFVYAGGERIALHRRGEGFSDKKGRAHFSRDELLQIAEEHPERLSNNVLSRPLMQEYLFPVLATVLGPSEIAYWGLLKQAFHRFGMRMPLIVPRMEFTLFEGTVQKQMDKFALSSHDVFEHLQQKKKDWLRAQDTLDLPGRFADAKRQFADLYRPLLETVSGIHPGMGKLGETNMQKIVEQIEFLEHRALDAFQSRFDSALRQWERIRLSLLPLGKPQERVYNVLAYLNKYGDGWIRELLEAPLENNGVRHLVYF